LRATWPTLTGGVLIKERGKQIQETNQINHQSDEKGKKHRETNAAIVLLF
jgi:hypothetical protein